MNFLNSFLGSSVPPSKMDSIVDNRRQLLAAMPKSNAPAQRAATVPAPATGASDAAFLNSQLDGGTCTAASGAHNNHSSTNHTTTSRSFYHEDHLLDPDFIDHLAEYSDTDEGPDDDWGNFGNDDDGYDANLEPGFTPENVFGPTEDDASSNAALNLKKPSVMAEAKYQYQATSAKPHVYTKPPTTARAAPQKRKSFTLTEEEPTMYIPDDMITIEAYMGPPADICPPSTGNNSQRRNSTGNISKDYYESESSEDSDDEEDFKKPAASSRDHADPFSKLAESSARTEATRRYLEESRRKYSSIPDFHRYSNSEQTLSIPANNTSTSSLLNYASDTNMNASSNSSIFISNHNSTSSFHTSFNSTGTLTIPENNPTSAEHQSRMSNLLTAMARTEQSRTLLRRRSEAAASATSVSASGITSLVMGRVGGPRKSRGASPPRSYQRLF